MYYLRRPVWYRHTWIIRYSLSIGYLRALKRRALWAHLYSYRRRLSRFSIICVFVFLVACFGPDIYNVWHLSEGFVKLLAERRLWLVSELKTQKLGYFYTGRASSHAEFFDVEGASLYFFPALHASILEFYGWLYGVCLCVNDAEIHNDDFHNTYKVAYAARL